MIRRPAADATGGARGPTRGPIGAAIALALAAALGSPAPAHAQPAPPTTDAVRAAEQFDLALKLKRDGDWDGACAAFAASQRLEAAIGTQLNLAKCLVRAHKLIAAAAMLRAAAAAADAVGDAARAASARADLADIEPRIPTFVVVVPPDATVDATLDGARVDDLSAPIPADPGFHRWVFATGGVVVLEREVVLAEGQHARIEVPRAAAVDPTPPPPPPPTTRVVHRRSRALAYGLGAGALLVAGGGTALLLSAHDLQDRAAATCPDPQACDREAVAQDYNDRAVQRSQLAVVALAGAGALAITAGIVWWRTRGTDDGPRPTLAVGPGTAVVTLGGHF